MPYDTRPRKKQTEQLGGTILHSRSLHGSKSMIDRQTLQYRIIISLSYYKMQLSILNIKLCIQLSVFIINFGMACEVQFSVADLNLKLSTVVCKLHCHGVNKN